ncbi:hypothetical protein FHS26_004742 [Rhizobium pisi]|uniref:Uncharacterized protein n=1 Tax=Rhizobium pisi TaxID=574561 RepID=A0A7W5G1H6_9HYPH|nr:hypothetical protein [Rhizobium pisi]
MTVSARGPGLPKRFTEKIPPAPDDPTTWFSQGIQGYVNYPWPSEFSGRE